MTHYRLALLFGALLPALGSLPAADKPPTIELARAGKALLPIVTAPGASERVRQAARTLADYLGRVAGAKFEVVAGDGKTGVAVGRAADFPELPYSKTWDAADPTRREDYLLRSHAAGLHIVGASDLAVEHAVWDLLYRLGCRQFFPGKTWEVLPQIRDLSAALDVKEHPAYFARRIWYGYGAGDWAKEPYAAWCARNRAESGIVLNTGHSYDGILQRNKAEFDRHPEYLGLVKGERRSTKFCISNPGLRRLVCDDALKQFAADPTRQSISVDPSDGGGWCECDQCKALGSVSDRALTLANEVAAAVEARYPGRYVGMYAYSQHSPPPALKVHPRVVVSVAAGFITGGYSVEQLLRGWQKQEATTGVREYFSVHPWDRDLPGKARAANPAYLQKTIPQFHDLAARFFSAESSDNWGCNGLGYFLAARMLWDTNEAKRLEELKADFFEKAFGPARAPMTAFYRLIDAGNKPLPTDDLVGRMYRLLAEARGKTDDASIRARLRDLTLYTRYVELWLDYAAAQGAARQKAFEALVRHAYRIRSTMMIHTLGLVRDLPRRDKTITLPREAARASTPARNPWQSDEPFSESEIDAILKEGIAARKLFDFKPVSFSDHLIPATKLALPSAAVGSMGEMSRDVRTYYTWVEKAPTELKLQAKAGLIYGNRGDALVSLFPAAEEEGKAVAEARVPSDKAEREVILRTTFTGLHRVEVSDHAAGTSLTWADGVPMTVASSPETPASFHGRWSLYFYVPKGTKEIGGYASGPGALLDGDGKAVHTFEAKPGYFRAAVAVGQDGKLWKFHNSSGQRLLMTVPPYLARSAHELLLPAEVVNADRGK